MSDSDDILQGFVIAGISAIVLSGIGWCLRQKRNQMVKSESTEDLSSISTEDPNV